MVQIIVTFLCLVFIVGFFLAFAYPPWFERWTVRSLRGQFESSLYRRERERFTFEQFCRRRRVLFSVASAPIVVLLAASLVVEICRLFR